MWVYEEDAGMTKREISYVPGFYKMFDEIFVNTANNKGQDPNMDTIKVDIDP
jgi:DNA topoisomerase-2